MYKPYIVLSLACQLTLFLFQNSGLVAFLHLLTAKNIHQSIESANVMREFHLFPIKIPLFHQSSRKNEFEYPETRPKGKLFK